ncbi:hypothetical protein [uncultured Marixanthomonas sp.]|uniref:hypothetical protein n=1 Tax=uncultured Marixanthomonas sp. TaxID=757245 RepID=UPI0030DAC4DA|tara:strand:+ start:64 stop:408 length:345 start_codon:yes stop_codon:yes gene_type:complete
MKVLTTIALFFILLTSCSMNNDKETVLGKWNSTTMHNKTAMHFYKDSLIIDKFGLHSVNAWKMDNGKLYIKRTAGESVSPQTTSTLDYKFSNKNDTLYLKSPKDSIFQSKYVKN